MSLYLKCTVTSYYLFLLLNRTTEGKTLPIAHVTQLGNSRPVMSQTDSRSRGSGSCTDHSI